MAKKSKPLAGRKTVPATALAMARAKVYAHFQETLARKGDGTVSSVHEILGLVTEEYHELIDAVHKHHPRRAPNFKGVHDELLDIATLCLLGVACIDAGTMDW